MPKKVKKTKARVIKVLKQTGKRKSVYLDKQIKAKLPGKRVSSSGKVYTETRRNRSDKRKSRL